MHIVLLEPEIPQNAGNVGRTCLALGARLHLVGPLGFSLDEKSVRRAGLDYWKDVDLAVHPDWGSFEQSLPAGARPAFFSSHGKRTLWEMDLASPAWLVFGSESRGFPSSLRKRYGDALVRIPMTEDVRSLNLATAAGIAAYEAARRLRLL